MTTRQPIHLSATARALGAAALTLATLTAATTAAASYRRAHAASSSCEEQGKHSRNGQAFHSKGSSPGGAIYEEGNGDLYVCSNAGGAPFDVGEGYAADTSWSRVVFAGQAAAVELTFRDNASFLVVANLQEGRQIYKRNLGGSEGPSAPGKELGRIVLKPDGAVAWSEDIFSESESEPSNSTRGDIFKHDRNGTKVLDATHTAKAWSLKLKGSKLQWIDGQSERRTVTLH